MNFDRDSQHLAPMFMLDKSIRVISRQAWTHQDAVACVTARMASVQELLAQIQELLKLHGTQTENLRKFDVKAGKLLNSRPKWYVSCTGNIQRLTFGASYAVLDLATEHPLAAATAVSSCPLSDGGICLQGL